MLDAASVGASLATPEAMRQWGSWGTVQPDSGDQKSVRFDDEDGNPLDLGALVTVKLHPSGNVVACRVGNHCAGAGEGEWHPFGPGDEVFVAIPNGNERAGCVILARGNQRYDAMPRTVAGMDVTKNNVAFKRLRVAYALESATGITFSVATTGSMLSLDPTGNVWLRDGNGNSLALTADVVQLGIGGSDITAGLQIDTSKKTAMLIAQSTALVLDDTDSQFQTGGSLKLSTAGNAALTHATSIEAVVNLLSTFLKLFAAVLAPVAAPLTGTSLAALVTPFIAPGGLAATIGASAALPLDPANGAAISSGLAPPAVPGKPGLGAAGLMI